MSAAARSLEHKFPDNAILWTRVTLPEGSELATLDPAAAHEYVTRSTCGHHNNRIVSSQIESFVTMLDTGLTAGTAMVPVTLAGSRTEIRCGVVDQEIWPLIVPLSTLKGNAMKMDFSSDSLRSAQGSSKLYYTANASDASVLAHATALLVSAAVDPNIFTAGWAKEIKKWDALYPLPTRESVARRFQLGSGAPTHMETVVIDDLMRLPRLVREYQPSAPPSLAYHPIQFPFKSGSKPAYVRQWSLSPMEQDFKVKVMRFWEEKGIIEPSNSLSSIPSFPVPKPGHPDERRIVSDCRLVNEALVDLRCDAPLLSEIHQ